MLSAYNMAKKLLEGIVIVVVLIFTLSFTVLFTIMALKWQPDR